MKNFLFAYRTNQIKAILFALMMTLMLTSCSPTIATYYPKINLDVSPYKINKTVRVEKFVDVSPSKDKRRLMFGTTITSPRHLANDLDQVITNEIVRDFSNNKLFKQVDLETENADYIIKGEIKKFYGVSKTRTLYAVSAIVLTCIGSLIISNASTVPPVIVGTSLLLTPLTVAYLGAHIRKDNVKIELVLYVYDKTNNLVGTYSCKENYLDKSGYRSNYSIPIDKRVDKIFSNIVFIIRQQILRDTDKFK